jgi:pyruvate/2-oxoglutarate dehydrogenase complex dihydrolipoamide acyltransferase (E2) component
MPIIKRRDGVYLKKLPGFRKMFPFLMPTRTESVIFYSQRVRLGETLAWLEKVNQGREKRLSVFHVVLAASARTLALRPDANRFIAGRRIYQRRTIDLSFVVKRELTEAAGETTVKITLDPRSSVFDVADQVSAVVRSTRGSAASSDEKTTDLLTSLPRFITRLAMGGVRTLDYFNLLPASYIKGDSLYTSVYLANLGSIGLDAVFHHMFEWGNAAFFIVVGKRKKEPVVNDRGDIEARDVLDMNISLDERITDGVHYAGTIAMLTDFIEHPSKLEAPPESLPAPFEFA